MIEEFIALISKHAVNSWKHRVVRNQTGIGYEWLASALIYTITITALLVGFFVSIWANSGFPSNWIGWVMFTILPVGILLLSIVVIYYSLLNMVYSFGMRNSNLHGGVPEDYIQIPTNWFGVKVWKEVVDNRISYLILADEIRDLKMIFYLFILGSFGFGGVVIYTFITGSVFSTIEAWLIASGCALGAWILNVQREALIQYGKKEDKPTS